MIPKIIHQTWKNHDLPVPRRLPESWKKHNPDWEYRFWTDEQLEQFVRDEYPQMFDLFMASKKPVQKADIARYLIIHKFGGIYADIDTECYASLAPLVNEKRVILAEEPPEHWCDTFASQRGMETMVFNGTFASPAGHPFWLDVMQCLHRCRHAKKDVLESTGPLMMSGCYINYAHPDQLALHSCHLFNPETSQHHLSDSAEFGPLAPLRISNHLWEGTWVSHAKVNWKKPIRYMVFKAVYLLLRGKYISDAQAKQMVNGKMLRSPLPKNDQPTIAILIPLRNAEPYLARCFALLNQLDYPKNHLKVTFCEGNSTDNSVAMLQDLIKQHSAKYLSMTLIHQQNTLKVTRKTRDKPSLQKKRRSAIAKVRNHLIQHGLDQNDDWALWIDVDVVDYPADILKTLLATHEKIVTPDCVLEEDGQSFDINAFLDVSTGRYHTDYYRYALNGIYQPRSTNWWRRHLHDLRYLNRVPLTSVGGAMLLVHASVHNAGLTFPEIPYCDLLETEGFGKMAGDLGVTPIGLPNVHIYHAKDLGIDS